MVNTRMYPSYQNEKPFSKWLLPCLWQLFLSFYFVKFFIVPLPFQGMNICLVVLPIYLAAYFWGYYQTDNKRLLAAVVMIACGVVATPYNYGASVFFQFAALYLGNSSKPGYALVSLAGLIGIILFLSFRYDLPTSNFTLPALLVSISLCAFGVFDRQRRINEDRIAKTEAQLQNMAAIAERERIGRDLHDVLGHTLTVITIKSSVVKKLLENKDYAGAEKEIIDVENTARHTSKMLQKVVSDYGDIAITDEINNLILLLEQLEIEVTSNIRLPNNVNESISKALSMIIRESITNVIKHSNASHCQIVLEQQSNNIHYKISDNGVNENHIDANDSMLNQSTIKFTFGHGLKGIRQRVVQLNGKFMIKNNQGTTLEILMPLNTEQ